MAEQLQEKTDWSKFFMAMAAGAVVIMQSYSQMQHNDTRDDLKEINKKVVPRTEFKEILEFTSDNLKAVLSDIDARLKILEISRQKMLSKNKDKDQ